MDAPGLAQLPQHVRSFVAIRMSAEVEASLSALIEELRRLGPGVRWVKLSNLHVTLKFLGPAVERGKLLALAEALGEVAAETSPFAVATRGAGAFPNFARPRVIWAGLESPELAGLAERVEAAAARCGFECERRPWSAHLTIGRVRDPRRLGGVRSALTAAADRTFGVSTIESVTLYRSTLRSTGSIYDPLSTLMFRLPS